MNTAFIFPQFFPSGSNSLLLFYVIAWLIYIAMYWACLLKILQATGFETNEKILWFLVITMAPLIGIITFAQMCPPSERNRQPLVNADSSLLKRVIEKE